MTAVGCTLTASLACAAQACCPSTCRTSVRSARSTRSMQPRGRSRRRSNATRRPAPTATASRATRPCPRAATGGAASRGCRRTATRTPAAPSGARSAPTPSGSARGRRGRRGTRSGWADRVLHALAAAARSLGAGHAGLDVACGPTAVGGTSFIEIVRVHCNMWVWLRSALRIEYRPAITIIEAALRRSASFRADTQHRRHNCALSGRLSSFALRKK